MLQLSIALIVDLGLNKVSYTSDRHQIAAETAKMFHGNSVFQKARTNDERRAFLGCFYLTSVLVSHSAPLTIILGFTDWIIRISSCFKKLDALRYTAHLEESCNALAQDPEFERDIYLVQLVRLQKIAEQITQSIPYDAPQSFWTSKPPIGMLVKAFEAQLEAFKGAIPRDLQHDGKSLRPPCQLCVR